jgi:hypothetical protein
MQRARQQQMDKAARRSRRVDLGKAAGPTHPVERSTKSHQRMQKRKAAALTDEVDVAEPASNNGD